MKDAQQTLTHVQGLGPEPLLTRRQSDLNVEETTFGELVHKGSLRMNNKAGSILHSCESSDAVQIAKKYYEAALQMDPEFSSANYNLALILENEDGDLEKAALHYKTAVKKRDGFVEAKLGYQRAVAKMHKLQQKKFDDELRELKGKFVRWGLKKHFEEFQRLMVVQPGSRDCLFTILKEEAFMQEKALKESGSLASLFDMILAEAQCSTCSKRLTYVLSARLVTQPLRISLKVIKMRFRFNLMELPKNHNSALQPKQTVLFRMKRLSAFNAQSYKFEEFLERHLGHGQPIYYVQTHKKQKTKKILESVLLFISFSSEDEAQDFLRACVRECLRNGVVKTMLTKEKNYNKADARALLHKHWWSNKELETVKKQHHFCLAE